MNNLNELLLHELRDLHSAETQLMPALQKLSRLAKNEDLRENISDHARDAQNHIERLSNIFDEMNETAGGVRCEGMAGLLREADDMVSKPGNPDVLDAALIGVIQRIQHYEIAGYGTSHALAKCLGLDDVADALKETLDEESKEDKSLTKLAEGGWFKAGINKKAR